MLHNRILQLLQLCDSAFPIGTFNHSYGMETYIRDGRIADAPMLGQWLGSYLNTQFTHGEALAMRLCFEALAAADDERITAIDHELTMSIGARETRNAAITVAQRMMDLILRLVNDPMLEWYHAAVTAKAGHGNPAVVFAIAAFALKLDMQEAVASYGYSVVSTLVQSGVRAIPLGQVEGQLLLQSTFPVLQQIGRRVPQLDPELLGANVPGIELAQIQHETQHFRLFMS